MTSRITAACAAASLTVLAACHAPASFAQAPAQAPGASEAAARAALLPPPVGLPPLGPPQPVILPAVTQKTLPNGLKIVVLEDHKQPALFMQLSLPAGTIRDPKNKVGLAEITAGLLDNGTEKRTEDQIADAVDTLGASLNASAGDDYLSVGASGLSNQADALMDLMADITLHPTFPPESVDRAKTRTLSGITAALGQPATVASAALARVVYGSHPYGNFSSGTTETVPTLTRADMQAFAQTYFAPNGATLFFVGDITSTQAETLAAKYFGGWEKKTVPAPPPAPTPGVDRAPMPKPRIFVIDRPGAAQTEVRIGALTPGYSDPKRVTASVASTVLGLGQFEGRLTKEIRVKRGLTYGAGSSFSRNKGAGEFFISTFTKNASTGEVVRVALAEVEKLQKNLTPPTELGERKTFLAGTFALSVATPDGLLGRLAPAVLYGNGPSDLTTYTRNVAAVTPQAVQETMQKLPVNRMQVVLVGDSKAIAKQLVGIGPVTVIPQEQLDLQSVSLKSAAAAQTSTTPAVPPTPAPTADEAAAGQALLQAAVKAHGGDAFLAVKSLKTNGKGELTPPGDSGLKIPIDALGLVTAPGGKTRLDLTTGFGDIIVGAPGSGKSGWLVFGGQVREQPEAGGLGNSGDPTALLRDAVNNKYAARPQATTEKTADGKALKSVVVTTPEGRPVTLFMEEATNVVRRIDAKQGATTSSILLADYKDAGKGVMLPGKIVITINGQETLNLSLDKFEINPTVSDAVFEKPKG